eukprot:CAMPEP_0174856168 /NCGR_PEP_ID=MMETSP1114-20130205/35232_1 /TAXON_ID=312471 /ORGANISM="Neobodo designis, Strain CCAP 1951/1" /LENGTH=504 /DNA_ID=CAMNT_0016090953 /DNA_START=49 /DNA_END=1564 /DNA_ORIENTATION=+
MLDCPSFTRTVDVLELVCETVGFDRKDALATQLAFRECSHACADAVSGAIRRLSAANAREERETAASASGKMGPALAHDRTSARLCVVSQRYGAITHWLRDIPDIVLSSHSLEDDMETARDYVPRVRSAAMRGWRAIHGFYPVRELFSRGSCLESLHFTDCNFVSSTFPSAPATLRTLRLSHCHGLRCGALSVIAKACPQVEHFSFSDDTYWGMNDSAPIIEALRHWPHLTRVDVDAKFWTDSMLLAIAEHCPRLRYLEVPERPIVRWHRYGGIDCDWLYSRDPGAVVRVAHGCPELRHVALSGSAASAEAIEAIVSLCPRLRDLELYAVNLTDQTANVMARHSPALQRLTLLYPEELSTQSIVTLLEGCSRLRHLDLTGAMLTREAMAAICRHRSRLETVCLAKTVCATTYEEILVAIGAPQRRTPRRNFTSAMDAFFAAAVSAARIGDHDETDNTNTVDFLCRAVSTFRASMKQLPAQAHSDDARPARSGSGFGGPLLACPR